MSECNCMHGCSCPQNTYQNVKMSEKPREITKWVKAYNHWPYVIEGDSSNDELNEAYHADGKALRRMIDYKAYEKLQKENEELTEQRNKINHEFKMLQSKSDRQRRELEELKQDAEVLIEALECVVSEHEMYVKIKDDHFSKDWCPGITEDGEEFAHKIFATLRIAEIAKENIDRFKSKYPAKKEE